MALGDLSRRALLRGGVGAGGVLALSLFARPAFASPGGADDFGPLQAPDANGLMLPPGFESRVIAVTGSPVAGTSQVWHTRPDGGATFTTPGGGWVYVSNSESDPGGVGAVRFGPDGDVVDAYTILSGTQVNCAGGPTPWGTWLSCEEVPGGRVYECDPLQAGQGSVRPALGVFRHEAVAADPVHQCLYLTEDQGDGLLYRFTPSAWPSLAAGTLEALEILPGGGSGPIVPGELRPVGWHPVPAPQPANGGVQNATHQPLEERATRYQVPAATTFPRGEGCWFADGFLWFSTTTNSRVWKLDTTFGLIEIAYDPTVAENPELTDPDNVFAAPGGDVYVAEDAGNLQIVALTRSGAVKPLLQLTGQTGTELTGPALSPDGTRMYFSSQVDPGTTYEVLGPFLGAPRPVSTGAAGSLLAGALMAAARWRLR